MSKRIFMIACVFALLAAVIVGTFMFRRELDSVRQRRDATVPGTPLSVAPR